MCSLSLVRPPPPKLNTSYAQITQKSTSTQFDVIYTFFTLKKVRTKWEQPKSITIELILINYDKAMSEQQGGSMCTNQQGFASPMQSFLNCLTINLSSSNLMAVSTLIRYFRPNCSLSLYVLVLAMLFMWLSLIKPYD